MTNPFVNREEVIFCTLEDMLISSRSGVLKYLIEHGVPEFEDSIDISKFKGLNEKNIVRLAVTSKYMNVACEVVTQDVMDFEEGRFGFDEDDEVETEDNQAVDIYDDITITDAIETIVRADMPNLYTISPKSDLAYGSLQLLPNKSLKKFIIYTEGYDQRVHDIINTLYASHTSKVLYVYGGFEKVIEKLFKEGLAPTSYFLNDVDLAKYIFDLDSPHTKFIEIMVGNLGFNYFMNELDDIFGLKHDFPDEEQKSKCKKFSLVDTFNLSEEYFTGNDVIETTLFSVEGSIERPLTDEERTKIQGDLRKNFDIIDEYGGYPGNTLEDNDGTKINVNKKYDKL